MNKILLIILTFSCFHTTAQNQSLNNETKHVKSVHTIKYRYEKYGDSLRLIQTNSDFINYYDEKSNILNTTYIIPDDQHLASIKYYYKEDKLIRMIAKDCDSSAYTYEYFYDENDCNFEQKFYITDSLIYYYRYIHDDSGNVNLFTRLNSQGDTLQVTYFQYDEKGNLTEITYFTGAPLKLFTIEKFKYDENSNKIESEYYSKDSVLTSKYVFQYDSLNRIQHTLYYNFTDDYHTELLNEEKEYFYTGNDTMPYETITRSFTNYVETNTYTYDSYGNWTEHRQEMHNGLVIYVAKRKIEYYKE